MYTSELKISHDEHYVIEFGKHKGQTLGSILSEEPSYLIWLHYNTMIKLDATLLNKAVGEKGSDDSVIIVKNKIYVGDDDDLDDDEYEYYRN